MYIAADASTTHLYNQGTRIHMQNALRHGATEEELFEVLAMTSVLGMQQEGRIPRTPVPGGATTGARIPVTPPLVVGPGPPPQPVPAGPGMGTKGKRPSFAPLAAAAPVKAAPAALLALAAPGGMAPAVPFAPGAPAEDPPVEEVQAARRSRTPPERGG